MVNDASAAQLGTIHSRYASAYKENKKKIYIEERERKKEDINGFYLHDQIKCSLYSRDISDTIYVINKRETNK